jgi:hypothetical protein
MELSLTGFIRSANYLKGRSDQLMCLPENIRRFYNNSMLDADKQAAINLFVG